MGCWNSQPTPRRFSWTDEIGDELNEAGIEFESPSPIAEKVWIRILSPTPEMADRGNRSYGIYQRMGKTQVVN